MAKTTGKRQATGKDESISLPRLNIRTVSIPIEGDSPLICERFSDRSRDAMLAKQTKAAKTARAAKDPEQDFRESLYVMPEGGYGFPAIAFKKAAVAACRQSEGIPMTQARGLFHVVGELVKLNGEPELFEALVRNASGVADIRFRGLFRSWSCELIVRYNADSISLSQLVHLFNVGGFACGVGGWRPEKSGGSYGMFHVIPERESDQ